jgi:TRAP-type mannitol/chloroaromatic compound transport system substrate-binding protein
MDRRQIVTSGLLAGAAAALAGCGRKSSTVGSGNSGKSYRWRLAMIVPKTLPLWGEAILRLAENVKTMTAGRLDIRVFGAGELFPALEVFDRVRGGQVQMGHSAAYYWQGKIKEASYFTSIPFGLNAVGMQAWLHSGGGQQLWDELYAPYGIKPFPCGNTGVQMGGWYKKEILSLEDLKGLKIRMPGLGGVVMNKAGAQTINIPGGEILTSLQTGVIDATEWVGPYHDTLMGFHKAANFYYSGGWHEPGSVLELIINKKAWEELSPDLQAIVAAATAQINGEIYAEWTAKDAEAFSQLQQMPQIKIQAFPETVTHAMKAYAKEVMDDLATASPLSAKIYNSIKTFQKQYEAYQDVSELAYARSVRS